MPRTNGIGVHFKKPISEEERGKKGCSTKAASTTNKNGATKTAGGANEDGGNKTADGANKDALQR